MFMFHRSQACFYTWAIAENSLCVIENKRLHSERDEPARKRSKKNSILFDQAELNDLIRDLNQSKGKAELLGSRLKEKNLLNENASNFFTTKRVLLIVTM